MQKIIVRIIILLAIISIPSLIIYKDKINSDKKTEIIPTQPIVKIVEPVITQDQKKVVSSPASVDKRPTIELSSSSLVPPNLDKKWDISADYSDDVKRVLNVRISDNTDSLKKNSDQFDKWIGLGTLRKTVGDYEEAKNIWEFASNKWPDGFVAFHNLGDLYAGYLKDPKSAEKNFLKVIELDPHYVSDYISLYNLYRRQYGEAGEKTGAILISGFKSNPKSVDLLVAMGTHYKMISDKENSKKYYEMALVEAKSLKNVGLQEAIQLELDNL